MSAVVDTPAAMIARLDGALERRGEDVFLRKTNTAVGQLAVRARVRFYRPTELVGLIVQGDSKVVISGTGLSVFGVPPINGYVVSNGVPRVIKGVTPTRQDGVLVRVDMQVRG